MVADHTGRPRLTSSRRRNWKQFLLSEWGLLLLAAVLTFIIWDNVRDKVIDDHVIENIHVELEVVPKGVDAVLLGDGTVDIKVRCSERERDEIIAQLRKDGEGELRVTMLVRDVPVQKERPLNATRDRFQWKFAQERVLREVSPAQPGGTVFRVKTQTLTVARPQHDLEGVEGIEVEIKVSPLTRELDLPVAALEEDEDLVPDALGLKALISKPEFQHGTPYPRTLTFDGWRSVKDGWRGKYREGLTIPPVRATVTVKQTGSEQLKNHLIVQLDPNNYEYEFEKNEIGGVLKGAGGNWLFTGTLKGRMTVLKELGQDWEKRAGGWHWGVRVTDLSQLPPRPPDGKDSQWETLNAEIVWVPGAAFRDRGVEFVPTRNQESFDLKVRWHPAHK